MRRDALLDKLKKLQALSESHNPHESALAMQRMQQILQKYNLDVSELKEEVGVTHVQIRMSKKLESWESLLATIVGQATMTKVWISTWSEKRLPMLNFAGTEDNSEAAVYMYNNFRQQLSDLCVIDCRNYAHEYHTKTGKNAWRERGDKSVRVYRNSWFDGAIYVIGRKVREQKEQFSQGTGMELMVVQDDAIAEYVRPLGLIPGKEVNHVGNYGNPNGFNNGAERGDALQSQKGLTHEVVQVR